MGRSCGTRLARIFETRFSSGSAELLHRLRTRQLGAQCSSLGFKDLRLSTRPRVEKSLFHSESALSSHLNMCIVLVMFPVEELGQEIAVLAMHIDAATHRLLECIRQFDEECGWEAQGAVSCAHWLVWRIGLDPATAREKVRVSRALGKLPVIDGALKAGKLSYAKVRALTQRSSTRSPHPALAAWGRDQRGGPGPAVLAPSPPGSRGWLVGGADAGRPTGLHGAGWSCLGAGASP